MLSWLYPDVCECCGERAENSLCPACQALLPRLPRPICLYCGAPVAAAQADAMRCPECSSKPRSFDFARAALMRTPETMQLVHGLKYHRANYLAPALAPLLVELWEQHPPLREQKDWGLVPVPVTKGRLFARGYNQAEELALALGKLRRLSLFPALQRLGSPAGSQTQ